MADHPNRGKGNDRWTPEHDQALLVQGIIALVKSNQTSLYLLPGIIGCVDGHGNDRTSKKVNQLLARFAEANNVDPAVVKSSRRKSSTDSPPRKKVKKENGVKKEEK
ncbi:hypothetical protein A1Q1_06173 [Trichosporon asahii var. asahii CBS 2479]|uniref:Uncharacterized protein n=1 Tax=Trichosporon asahii var. asahii (strain ATCC 90039 / CBS 2479 / JCM 2466 / KCTC 7840 / NBRC 103889/ NCYC 2677 / UAMH 7654) TaxID=1186058 RepID=J4U5U7_TRIAS|nr:hypothetical protein A1Q1_06173 [Trichosporon asahii var. asahii CBS 2479]EJT45410.1 hypothetical protein A1Q1_06173 [Trichosporon asahii var. asahii CBS 2479]